MFTPCVGLFTCPGQPIQCLIGTRSSLDFLMKVSGKIWVHHLGIELKTSNAAGVCFNHNTIQQPWTDIQQSRFVPYHCAIQLPMQLSWNSYLEHLFSRLYLILPIIWTIIMAAVKCSTLQRCHQNDSILHQFASVQYYPRLFLSVA